MQVTGLFNYNDVFKYVDQLAVWKDICNDSTLQINEMICNPLRADNNPSCYLREYNQVILMTDYAFPEYNKYTCVHAVAQLHNITLNQAAQVIIGKYVFNTNLSIFNPVSKQRSGIKVKKYITENKGKFHFVPHINTDKEPTFTKQGAEYWIKRGITSKQLKEHNVYSVYCWYYNDRMIIPKSLCFAYYEPDTGHTKLYQPLAEHSNRFPYSSMTKNHINKGNTHVDSNIAILTKSLKDLMVLENMFPDVNIYSIESESMIPDDLSLFCKYDKLLVLFDNDEAGIYASNKMCELLRSKDINAINVSINVECFPDCKDADDIIVKHQHLIPLFIKYIYDS